MTSSRLLMPLARGLAVLSILAPLALPGCGSETASSPACSVGDVAHAPGESFAMGDGCNTCTCSEDGSVVCSNMACADGCLRDGVTHASGDSFPDADGCNICTCAPDGFIGCTALVCVVTCDHNGGEYPQGQAFPAGDGCNECECEPDGMAMCTRHACSCNPQTDWWLYYAGTSKQECAAIDFDCPSSTTPFANECGCGCQQHKSCPETFDCTPPKVCDEDAILAACPYSTILS